MDEYYREEKSSPARFRESLLGGQASAVRFLLERAARRGEVESSKLSDMVIAIPGAFLAYVTANQAHTQAHIEVRAAVEEMIDSILLPRVGTKKYRRRDRKRVV